MAPSRPASMPPQSKHCVASFPSRGVLLVLIDRQKQLNSLSVEASFELDAVFRWFDEEPSLRVAVISGKGRAFCVGADLKEWLHNANEGIPMRFPQNGLGGLTMRHGKKPIIAAVNGPAYGSGCEIVLNCDMVVAARSATFALSEVKRGMVAYGGGLPRIVRTIGRQRAAELVLTGRTATADEFERYGICNYVVDEGTDVVDKALEFAAMIADNSPDSVIISREGLKLGLEAMSIADADRIYAAGWAQRINDGANMKEGLRAFREKRGPKWVDSKL